MASDLVDLQSQRGLDVRQLTLEIDFGDADVDADEVDQDGEGEGPLPAPVSDSGRAALLASSRQCFDRARSWRARPQSGPGRSLFDSEENFEREREREGEGKERGREGEGETAVGSVVDDGLSPCAEGSRETDGLTIE